MGKSKQSQSESSTKLESTNSSQDLSSLRLRRQSQPSTSKQLVTRSASHNTPDKNALKRKRNIFLRYYRSHCQSSQARYHQNLTELTFLQGGAFLINYFDWRRKNRSALTGVLRSGHLDADDLADVNNFISGHASQVDSDRFFPAVSGLTENLVLTDFDSGPSKEFGLRLPSKQPKRSGPVPPSDSDDDLDDATALGEEINQKALEEAQVLCRVSDLKKAGLWTENVTMKIVEPVDKNKYYLDNLFAEVQWLSDDFFRERQWKKAAAKKLSQAAVKCVKEQDEKNKRAAKEEMIRLRKLAASVSKMVRDWWRQMDKIVQAKHQVRLVAKRQQAMNTHLGKVIETTEKYTEWLTEGLNASLAQQDDQIQGNDPEEADEDFVPSQVVHGDLTDDEETIAREEEEHGPSAADVEAELLALRAEGERPLEEIIAGLPSFMEEEGGLSPSEEADDKKSPVAEEDNEFEADEDSDDDETTMVEQECHEGPEISAKEEVDMLEEEANMTMEELIRKYQPAEDQEDPPEPMQVSDKEESGSDEEEETESEISTSEESEKETSADDTDNEEDEVDIGLKDLFTTPERKKPAVVELQSEDAKSKPVEEVKEATVEPKVFAGEEEFNAIAQEALSLQPRGFTLDSAQIMVKVPYLIKHELREYQQVGLDWLATIYEKRLNGILADEMGLGKTIQTIALLAHIACEKSVWGPHLIVVPTSVMLNWEMEFKKWCPGFKILTYYGSLKERKEKRKGWTKTNAFHVCITSYKLAVQDQNVFKRKKWKYLILDEAQNIKNFKSQRWQTLLTFNSQRRLLLTGTPLQNTLMELWSLMHFLMPNIFQSHREFQEWFASPLTGMIEGNNEYNEQLVKRLHKVLRPFILRRLKKDVEKQMPKKYEHVIICRLSRRQRFLYDDFMSLTSTSSALNSGHFLSVINILMQLRKVCNHPDILEPRPILSPLHMATISLALPRLLLPPCDNGDGGINKVAQQVMTWSAQAASLADMARDLSSFVAERVRGLKPRSDLIQHVDSLEPARDVVQRDSSLPDFSRVFLPRGVVNELHDEFCKEMALIQSQNMEPQQKGKIPFPYPPNPTFLSFERKFRKTSAPDPLRQSGLPPEIISQRCQSRLSRLSLMSQLNDLRCAATAPLYPADLVCCLRRLFLQLSPSQLPTETGLPIAFISPKKSASMQQLQLLKPAAAAMSWRMQGASFSAKDSFTVSGYANCWRAQTAKSVGSVGGWEASVKWGLPCRPLCRMIASPEDRIHQLKTVIDRFVFVVPPAVAPKIEVDVSSASYYQTQALSELRLSAEVTRESTQLLHKISSQQLVQFPDARLIQYDCGKLQTMEVLLRDLKSGQHRVLIFTQMTRMLDILEHFLSYHGHRYLRLDGATKVEQRQLLMELFNQDARIFAFILSTRSGGLGVNLTGADTVIFYDSDWNPTMDAQAQDRCHRIGQTRDVHIYRLISEKTIEENILKKANQKRFLSDVAIEGGQFTTAYFRHNTIKDLFEEPSGLEDLAREKNAAAAQASSASDVDLDTVPPGPVAVSVSETAKNGEEESQSEGPDVSQSEGVRRGRRVVRGRRGGRRTNGGDVSETALEAALEEFEDENDRTAASKAKAEAKAELAEFDESIPWEEGTTNAPTGGAGGGDSEREDRAERELQEFHNQLRPIERFGVNCLESIWAPCLLGQLELADAQLEQSKATWELDQLVALREAEELRAEVEDDDMLYCAPGSYDLTKQRRELDRIKRREAQEAQQAEREAQEAREARQRRMAEQQRRRQALAANISAAQRRVKCAAATAASSKRRSGAAGGQPAKRKIAPPLRFELPTNAPMPDDSPSPRGMYDTPLDLSSPTKHSSYSANSSPCKQPRLDPGPITLTPSQRPPGTPNRVPIPRLPPSYLPPQQRSRPARPFMQPRSKTPQTRLVTQTGPPSSSMQPRPMPPMQPRLMVQTVGSPMQPRSIAPFAMQQQVRPSLGVQPSRPTTPTVQYRPSTTPLQQAPPATVNMSLPQRYVEPHFPVITGNGIRSVAPASQLLFNGQPVLVITRQSKTPAGEIVEQRFTQPIQPNQQYLQVVQRLRHSIVIQQNQQHQQNSAQQFQLQLQPRIVSMPTTTPRPPVSLQQQQHIVHQTVRPRGPRPLRPAVSRFSSVPVVNTVGTGSPVANTPVRTAPVIINSLRPGQPSSLVQRHPTPINFILQPHQNMTTTATATSIQPQQCYVATNGGQSPLATHVVKIVAPSPAASQAPLG